MAFNIGELVGYVKIDHSGVRSGMQGAEREVKSGMDRTARAAEQGGKETGTRFASGLSSNVTKGLDGVTKSWKSLGAGLLAGFAVDKVIGFLGDSIQAAGDLQQSMGGVDSVFKESAQTIHDFGKSSAESVGLSTNAFNQLVTVTGAMLKNKGLEDFAQKSLDLVKVGADLAAQFGGSTKDAVDALNAAMRGESDPIERYGISLNETAVNAELARKGLKNLTGTALDQAKAQARIDIVMRQSADAVGKFADEADTLQGQQQRLNAEWENAQAALGESLLPTMTSFVEAMRGGVELVKGFTSALSEMPGWLKFIAETLGRILSPLTGLLEALGFLSPEQEKAAESADKQAKATADAAEATRKAAEAAAKASPNIDVLAAKEDLMRKAAEAAKDAHKDLAKAILDVSDAAVSADQAEADWQQAIDDATAAIKENHKTVNKSRTELDLNTEAGRNNQDALIGLRDAAVKNSEAMLTQGDSTDKVKAKMADAREEFIKVATKMGLSKTAAEKLATQYGITAGTVDDLKASMDAIPKEVKSTIEVSTAGAKIAMAGINAILTAYGNRVVTATVRTNYVSTGRAGPTAGNVNPLLLRNRFGGPVGPIPGYAGGTLVGPGTGTSDSIAAFVRESGNALALSNGEFISTDSSRRRNQAALEAGNKGAMLQVAGGSGSVGGEVTLSRSSLRALAREMSKLRIETNISEISKGLA